MATTYTPKVVSAVFNPTDVASDRTIGVHQLLCDTIPNGSVITRLWYNVGITFTSAGADAGELKITVSGSTGDAVASTAISAGGNIWDAGLHAPTFTPATLTQLSNGGHIVVTTAAQLLTGGSMTVFAEYVPGN